MSHKNNLYKMLGIYAVVFVCTVLWLHRISAIIEHSAQPPTQALQLPKYVGTPYHDPISNTQRLPRYAPLVDATSDDFTCLALNIYFEARNQSVIGQLAVGLVTLNRVAAKSFKDTICGVVKQRKQFSWFSDGLSDKPKNKKAFDKAMILASVLLDKDNAVEDFTMGATHYHAVYVDPSWARYLKKIVKIEDHLFFSKK